MSEERRNDQTVDDVTAEQPVKKTSTGLDEKLAGLICYLGGFITGIIFYFIEKESKFIRFHAAQSTILFLALFLLNILLGWTIVIPIILLPVTLILWILMMLKAYKGEWYRLPLIAKCAEQLAEKQI